METSQALLLHSYGLSLADHYWLQPVDRELYWKELNFFENDFSEDLGNLLTDSKVNEEGDNGLLKASPSASVNGDMKKKWVIRDGVRCLLKVNTNYYSQQAVNEVIASRLHERLERKNHVPYSLEKIRIGGKDYPCSLSPLFTSETKEFVSAYQLLMNYKIPNESSLYASLISKAVAMGLEEKKVRQQLEYTIMTDFILSNTDRHLNNMGFLWETEQHRFTDMAPIFDTGNRLFIGEDPQLIVELETQENYIKTGDRLIEYHRKVGLSPDLLAGKRANVLETALEAYYLQACRVAEGIRVAEEYRKKRS